MSDEDSSSTEKRLNIPYARSGYDITFGDLNDHYLQTHPTPFEYWGGFTGLCGGIGRNYSCRRAMWSRKPLLVVWALGGAFVGSLIDKWRIRRKQTNILYMLDYIEKHPDLFPPKPSRKWAQVFDKWTPAR